MLVYILIAVIVIGVGVPLVQVLKDKKEFNEGTCPHCNKGEWKLFDYCGGAGYKCTHCSEVFWTSGYVRLHPTLINNMGWKIKKKKKR